MIKVWATVISWEKGEALLRCDVNASCQSCASRAGCGSRLLNNPGPQNHHFLSVASEQPLMEGQNVELGVAEGSLIGSALLVYMSPLVGLFLVAAVLQGLFSSDLAAFCGAILGGAGGFLIARGFSTKLSHRAQWQPVILSVAPSPGALRVETITSGKN